MELKQKFALETDGKKVTSKSVSTFIQQLVFVGPAALFFTIIVLIPFGMGMYYSFTEWNGVSNQIKWVGLDNFIQIFNDEGFKDSFWFTVRFTVTSVILTNVLGFVLSLILTRALKLTNVLRTVFFLPNVIAGLLLGFIWQFIFIKGFEAIGNLTGIELFNLPWLGTAQTGFWAIVIVSVWQGAGYLMIIYIAALNNVPKELMEAAEIDGASYWQVLKNIVAPMIMPAVTVCLFLSISWSFKMFDLNFALTKGGPFNSTKSVALDIYVEAFQNNRYGLGTAKALIFFLIVAAVTSLQVWVTKRKEIEA